VDERARRRIHINNCKDNHIEAIEVAIPKGIIGSISALMTHQIVLQIGEI
jgi:hypothetical protein